MKIFAHRILFCKFFSCEKTLFFDDLPLKFPCFCCLFIFENIVSESVIRLLLLLNSEVIDVCTLKQKYYRAPEGPIFNRIFDLFPIKLCIEEGGGNIYFDFTILEP